MYFFFYSGSFRQDGSCFPLSGATYSDTEIFPFSEVYESFKYRDGKFTILDWKQISEEEYDAYQDRHKYDGK